MILVDMLIMCSRESRRQAVKTVRTAGWSNQEMTTVAVTEREGWSQDLQTNGMQDTREQRRPAWLIMPSSFPSRL